MPFAAHIPLQLKPEHFTRWVALFKETAVEVLDAASDAFWTKVRVGTLIGYMARPYLAFGALEYGVVSMNPVVKVRATDGSARLALYALPAWDARILDQYPNGAGAIVLGVDPAWIHVYIDGKTGFMPADGLSSVDEAFQAMLEGIGYNETGVPDPIPPAGYGQRFLYATQIALALGQPEMELSFWGSTTTLGTTQIDLAYLMRGNSQLQEMPIGVEWDGSTAIDEALVLEDVNFDGYLDFRICRSMGAYNHYYDYWTWDPVKQAFFGNQGFNELEAEPAFDAASGRILCSVKDGAANYYEFTYELDYGIPVMTEKRDIFYKDQHNRTVTLWQRRNGQLVHVVTRNERVD